MSQSEALFLESLSTTRERNDIAEYDYKSENIISRDTVREYYSKVADYIFPYIKNRPQIIKRDYSDQYLKAYKFSQNKQLAYAHEDVIEDDYSELDSRDEECIVCYNKETLEYINNLGCIEITPWHSSIENLDHPDYMIISIEPSKRNTFIQAVRVAKMVKGVLDKAGADGFCKTSGDLGLHIYVPVGKKYPYRLVRELAYTICLHTNFKIPELTSLQRDQAEENQKVYLNYQINRRGQTLAAPYSMRPHSWAPVSTPLLWSELKDDLNPFDFNINTVPHRLEKCGEIFLGIFERGIDLENCMRKLQYE